ncbi:uncharacterized protein LOC131685582 [Topomyia yanbarensis]|uniref:uncharacterized protein LOC131685582 n=1 Tax=Topomyia yanbarensis TaxID=2498891 RepID=UPI00273AE110|nr:uncharacterized protein LOC131685582 [Topomyia yanbarensis]
MANIILHNVQHCQATCNTKYHCLYGYYFLGISRARLSIIYKKSKTTISTWIQNYETEGILSRKQREQVFRKFKSEHRHWIEEQYMENPVLFLSECRDLFYSHFYRTISESSICRILHAEGLSWETLERRAIQVKEEEIFRFCAEMNAIDWDIYHLVFLDEVSLDSRDMLRNRGYGIKGKKLIFRGEFVRRPRVSFLCFLGMEGMLDSFETEGTFTRKIFFECCQSFALNHEAVRRYPGFNSIWIMDGARIHCDQHIVMYLRSIGVLPVFLPPYCPFFNPIEIIFGITKRNMKKRYEENSNENLSHTAIATFFAYSGYNCSKLYKHCGYLPGGIFDPSIGLSQDMTELGFDLDTAYD